MSERNFVDACVAQLKLIFRTNWVAREFTLTDDNGMFRADVALVSGKDWFSLSVGRVDHVSSPAFYRLPIGQDLAYSQLREAGLGRSSVNTLVESRALERVARGFYIRHQPAHKLGDYQQLILIEFKIGPGDLNKTFKQALRYCQFGQVYVALPHRFAETTLLKYHNDLVGLLMLDGRRQSVRHPAGQGAVKSEAGLAYALDKLKCKYVREMME